MNRKEYRRQWYQKNKERINKYLKQWREDNTERVKQYRENNKEKIRGSQIRWCENNPEYQKQYRLINYKKLTEREKLYRQTPEGKACNQRAHAKRKASEKEIINTLTSEEWIDILKEHKFRCAYCGCGFTLFDRETRDHIIPISKGGNNIKENIVPACRSCNSKKHNKIL